MIKDKVVGFYVSELHQLEATLKDALVNATSWDWVLKLQGQIHGVREAEKLLNNVLEDEDK